MAQLQTYCESGPGNLIPMHPTFPGADWYKREDVDKLLTRKQLLIDLLSPLLVLAVEDFVKDYEWSVAVGEPDVELAQLLEAFRKQLHRATPLSNEP